MGANNNNIKNENNRYGNDNDYDGAKMATNGERTAYLIASPSSQRLAGSASLKDQQTSVDPPAVGLRKTKIMVNISEEKNQTHEKKKKINHQSQYHSGKACSLFISILLPFLLVFLLPSTQPHLPSPPDELDQVVQVKAGAKHSLDQLLLSLLRLPLDRFRLSTVGYPMMLMANAKEIQHEHAQATMISSSRQIPNDPLQEEETHMLVVAPEQQGQRQQQQQQLTARHPATAYGGEHESSYVQDYGVNHANLINNNNELATGELDSATEMMPPSASGSVIAPSSGTTSATRTDLPSVRALNVKCEKNHMTVNIVFDRPFYGMVFSKGHYNDQKCVHLPPNSGQTSVNFDIHLGKCGMSSSSESSQAAQQQQSQAIATSGQQQQPQQPNGLFIENTIIIQYDPQVQEIYDQARRLRCTWYDYYEKSVTFRPYNVDMLDAVTANFLGDNIQCWMQIQVGKGPWSSEVAGIVKIGQTMTMVLAIKDDENKFDMLVRNCVASDGKHQPIQLVDEYGCVARPKIMAKFQKAFKFPDSMSVHFQCVIQVCRYECPEPVCSASSSGSIESAGSSSGIAGGNGAGTGANSAAAAAAAAASSQDYAASGTELVSSKELPSSIGSTRRGQNLSHSNHLLQQQQVGAGSNSVNLKLDESLGRVQVKLDTSMMANNGLRPSGGALPPHLLHSQADQTPGGAYATPGGRGGHTYMSSSYYRPSVGSATAAAAASPSAGGGGAPVSSSRPLAPPSGSQHQQYSNPAAASSLLPPQHQYHHHYPRPAYMMTNRMGELVAEDGVHGEENTKLSLIASPRALPYAMPTSGSNHRYRRSINETSSPKTRRQTVPSDSTAIKTQRTIQVVSPDDVAFNLLDLAGSSSSDDWQEPLISGEWTRNQMRRTKHQTDQMVCFSSFKLITSALASLALLVTLILAAIFIIVRQRKRLDEKLSPVYDSSSPDLIINSQSLANHHMQQQQQQRQRATAEELILRRQREEIQQRNTYLGRLYSQFVPAAYWR